MNVRHSIGILTACCALCSATGQTSLLRADEKSETPVATTDLRTGSLPLNRILFLGNSITLHGPAPQIGWTGNWGMAASTQDKDYVHQLLARIAKHTGGTPQVMVRNIADFERNLEQFDICEALREELAFEADVVILAIGENAAALQSDADRTRFSDSVAQLLTELKQRGSPVLFVRSQFWPDMEKDARLKRACEDAGGVFVDISPLGNDPANAARAERTIEHDGVAGHPGDKGMAAIADELWNAMQRAGKTSR